MMKLLKMLIALSLGVAVLTACGKKEEAAPAAPEAAPAPAAAPAPVKEEPGGWVPPPADAAPAAAAPAEAAPAEAAPAAAPAADAPAQGK